MDQNSRKSSRPRITLPVRFILISGEDRRKTSRFYNTRTWDVSLRGIAFTTPTLKLDGIHFFYDSIPTVRNQILVQIQTPGEKEPITALGYSAQVKRITSKEREVYLVAFHFLQISESHGGRLRDLIESREEHDPQRKEDG